MHRSRTSNPTRVVRAKLAAASKAASMTVLSALCAAALLPGQIQPLDPTGLNNQPQQGQDPQGQYPQGQYPQGQGASGQGAAGVQRSMPGAFLQSGGLQRSGGDQEPDGMSTIWSAPSLPRWSGFPTFPSRLQGYGSYPLPGDPSDPLSSAMGAPLPAAEPEPPGWPSWVRLRARKPLPFAVDVGLLIAQRGRTWFRSAPDEPYVPSMLHDKFASLPVGSGVEIRADGACEVLLHQSTRAQAMGRTRLDVVALDEEQVVLSCTQLSTLRIRARGRRHTVRLPDGSELQVEPADERADDAPAATGLGGLGALFGLAAPVSAGLPAEVDLRRVDEPTWYGGRATITNLGGRAITWRHAFGETEIPPSHRVTFFLTPPAGAANKLSRGDCTLSEDGALLTCRAIRDTDVAWCGAKVAVPAGGTVRLESLVGPIRVGAERAGGG